MVFAYLDFHKSRQPNKFLDFSWFEYIWGSLAHESPGDIEDEQIHKISVVVTTYPGVARLGEEKMIHFSCLEKVTNKMWKKKTVVVANPVDQEVLKTLRRKFPNLMEKGRKM